MRRVRVRVPASTANLGSGFDTLGMALRLYNEVELTDEGEGIQLLIEGEGKPALEKAGAHNLVLRAVKDTLRELGAHPVGLRVRQGQRIAFTSPTGRPCCPGWKQ